ncbi:MAG TPA: ribulose phosphate epimerase, partial [Chloroflexota bacterium]
MAGEAFPILLTFDLDAESAILARNPEDAGRPVTLSRGRYGPKRGLPRLLALLRREQIPATFFVPGWVVEH